MESAQSARPSRKPWLFTLALLVGAALVLLISGLLKGQPPPPPEKKIANVEVSTLETRPYLESLVLPARIRAKRSAQVSAEFGARLSRWVVAEGARVERGAVVAELDGSDIRASLGEAQARHGSANAALGAAELAVDHAVVSLDKARRDAQALKLDQESAQSALDLARANYDRAENLLEKGVMDRSQLDRERNALAQAEVGVKRAKDARERAQIGVKAAQVGEAEARSGTGLARARLAEIEASIGMLEVRLAKHTLRAPTAGVLEEHLAEPGEVVAQGQPLARIYDLSALRVVVDVPDRYVSFLDTSNPALAQYIQLQDSDAVSAVKARLIVPGLPKLTGGRQEGMELDARIVRVAMAADPTSHTFPVELEADNPGGALREGLIARAEIDFLRYPEAVVIPLSAVQVTDLGPRVLVVEEAGGLSFVHARTIEPLSIRGNEVHVGSGLVPGDRLVISGWKGVVPGEQVRVIKSDGQLIERER